MIQAKSWLGHPPKTIKGGKHSNIPVIFPEINTMINHHQTTTWIQFAKYLVFFPTTKHANLRKIDGVLKENQMFAYQFFSVLRTPREIRHSLSNPYEPLVSLNKRPNKQWVDQPFFVALCPRPTSLTTMKIHVTAVKPRVPPCRAVNVRCGGRFNGAAFRGGGNLMGICRYHWLTQGFSDLCKAICFFFRWWGYTVQAFTIQHLSSWICSRHVFLQLVPEYITINPLNLVFVQSWCSCSRHIMKYDEIHHHPTI